MKKVSLIVPIYNSSKYLKRCLDSLVNQTLNDIEIIIVNDGSKDKSEEIIKEYSLKNDNIIYIKNKENKGIGYSRNKGISYASGEYIGFVDSDDYVSLDMYNHYYNFAKKNNLDLTTGHYYKVNNKNINIFYNNYFDFSNYKLNPNLIYLLDLGPCNKLYKTNIIKEYNINFEEKLKFEDAPFILKYLYHAKMIGHINNPYYYYCIRDESETTTIDHRTKDIFDILKIINNYYKQINDEIEYLNIREITMYMLKQKYQMDKKIKLQLINYGYEYLNNHFPRWKKNKYYLDKPFYKRFIKNNRILLVFYCNFKVIK